MARSVDRILRDLLDREGDAGCPRCGAPLGPSPIVVFVYGDRNPDAALPRSTHCGHPIPRTVKLLMITLGGTE